MMGFWLLLLFALVGFSSDPNYEKHSVMFNDDGSIRKPYSGVGADEQQVIIPGRIVRGLSGEAVNILREPSKPWNIVERSWKLTIKRSWSHQSRPTESVQWRLQVHCGLPCPFIHFPRSRASNRQNCYRSGVPPYFPFLAASSHDQNDSPRTIDDGWCVSDSDTTRLSRRFLLWVRRRKRWQLACWIYGLRRGTRRSQSKCTLEYDDVRINVAQRISRVSNQSYLVQLVASLDAPWPAGTKTKRFQLLGK